MQIKPEWKKRALDQGAHALVVAVIFTLARASGPAGGFVGALLGTLGGFAIGLLAEVKEEGNPVTGGKVLRAIFSSKEDMFFYALFGAALGVF